MPGDTNPAKTGKTPPSPDKTLDGIRDAMKELEGARKALWDSREDTSENGVSSAEAPRRRRRTRQRSA